MSMIVRVVLSFVIAALYTNVAEAAPCVAPETPHFAQTKPKNPNKPECLQNSLGCDRYVASQYEFDLKKYQEETRVYRDASSSYLSKLRNYLSQAQDFVQCEAQKL